MHGGSNQGCVNLYFHAVISQLQLEIKFTSRHQQDYFRCMNIEFKYIIDYRHNFQCWLYKKVVPLSQCTPDLK